MTTAEKYRQLEKSPAINIARYIFSCLKTTTTNSTLGEELIEIKTGKTPSKQNKKFYEDDYLNWFKPDEIGSEKYLFKAKDKLSKFAYENNQATIYEPDTILINAIGDVGRISILKNKASSNQQITGIRLNKKIDVDYAYFYLLANRKFFYVDLFQTTLPIVNQKKINSIPFAYPDIKEQRNIVEGLIRIDNIKSIEDLKIIDELNWNNDYKNACRNFFSVQFNSKNIATELTHQLSLVKKLRQQLLQDAVQGKLLPQNKNDEPASELLKKIKAEKEKLIAEKKIKKEKELQSIKPEERPFEIPENWVWCRLGEILNEVADVDHKMPAKINDGIPYISPRDFYGKDGIDFENAKKISLEDYSLLSRKIKPEKFDIIFPRYGTIGVCRFLNYEKIFLPSYSCVTLKTNKTFTNPKYVFYYCISPLSKLEIAKHTVQTTQPNVGIASILEFVFPLPPLEVQNEIVAKFERLDKFCDDLNDCIKQSESQNEKLLQQVLREALRREPVEA